MPSRKEIAGWLRERADQLFREAQRLENDFGQRDACLARAVEWEDRSALVENMRCETCERYVSGEDDEACTFNQIEYQGPGFGCFFHRQKEVNE